MIAIGEKGGRRNTALIFEKREEKPSLANRKEDHNGPRNAN